ncbi:hypothetical protein PSN45_003242 [Yamadazyma tenuis]|uniref:Uncharacterized protein n=1 Tax=Candida tenuis (strain ATCC 10573 / BCRC 21748 / CBS 615 / JCM 9827 / NBRC 10315 / NRRL Y-1498 / VKM Y-70) TaxID=590646 RepID=G3AYX3_CANTC|nr:uncharacterized protein CANTEDRAFT_97023 [Yamadazyma tenuis ATCC 10573]EGV65952.1 hypothetical protein CANTEDRAFT_97023 [Yamadazyma tenuis ATCC 10573]WEJ95715.1 hypothetical protein PSN45_003242 [Yamadazyma tenuis]
MSQVFVAKVKNVLNGDTIVLVPSKTTQVPAPERVLTLSYVRSNDSFESREFVRQLLIGKDVKFKVEYKNPTTGREFGDVQAPIFKSLAAYLVERGIVKLKDNINEDSEFIENLRALEEKAKTKNEGLWDSSVKPIEVVAIDEAIIEKSQKNPITTIVERVISGDRVIGRIIVNKHQHVSTPLLLAGLKCPRTDDASQSKLLTTTAQQAKSFVEDKFLTTKAVLKVKIVGENQAGLPVALFEHPSGNNIHEKLLENGLAEVVDWQSTLIGSSTMSGLRKAEQTAKALGKGMYATAKPSGTSSTGALSGKISTKHLRPGLTIDGVTITRVVQADTLNIRIPSGEEITVQLASVRAPKPNDSTVTSNKQLQLAIANSAREFVRQYAAGKSATVYIDGFRNANKELGFDSRFLVSVKIGKTDLSELILENGWAGVIKHNKQTLDERSLNWDKLVEIEEEQKRLGKNGVYYKGDISKIVTVGTRIVDASENSARAKSFFGGFKQKGRIGGGYHVEFVPSTSKVRLFNPKEGLKLTLILGGLSNQKNEVSEEGLKYLNSKVLQKNIEFEVYDMDKIGGFIGNLFLNSSSLKPFQVNLLEQGYVQTHDIAVGFNSFEKDLVTAEDSAKSSKKGLWAHERVDQIAQDFSKVQLEVKPIFRDIEVTYVDSTGVIYFQNLDAAVKSKFNSFKQEFDEFHQQIPSATSVSSDLPFNLTKAPKKNEYVSIKLEDNNKYYRGKVLGYNKATGLYEVKHIDYGNVDEVPLSSLRALPLFYSVGAIPAFSNSCKLQYVELAPSKPVDYLTESLNLLDELTFEKKLVISGLPSKTTGVDYDVILYDSEASLKDPTHTLNKQMVKKGLAIVDEKQKSTNEIFAQLKAAQTAAINAHKGCWEYGEVAFEEED